MIKNYILIALRNLKRYKLIFTLNILGLTLGITCLITLGSFIYSEVTYDSFFAHADRLYRVTTYFKRGDQEVKWAITNGGLVPILQEKVSGVEDATMCLVVQSNMMFQIGDRSIPVPERTGFAVEPNFLSILNFEILAGVDSTMLNQPGGIVLTEKMSMKLFGTENALGESITLLNESDKTQLTVSGILKNPPENSHMQFDFLLVGNVMPSWKDLKDTKRGGFPVHIYFRTMPGVQDSTISRTLKEVTTQVYGPNTSFPIQKVTDIHFHADNLFEHARKGNEKFILLLIIVALFILTIAIVNYIILSAAQTVKRAKEMAVRKSLVTSPFGLMTQFLLESSGYACLAGVLAVLLSEGVFRTVFPAWFDVHLTIVNKPGLIISSIGLAIALGFFAGFFPAVNAMRFNTIDILKSAKVNMRMGRFSLRTGLVTIQFVFTLTIIVGCVVVTRQLHFLENKDLGFKKEWVINLQRPANISGITWKHLKENLDREASIASTSITLYKFISDYNASAIRVMDEENADTLSLRIQWNAVDHDLVKTLDMQMVEGRFFSPDIASDSVGIVLNEAAARQLGIQSATERKVLSWFFGGEQGKILGVINDFHFQTFDNEIIPIALILPQRNFLQGQNMLVKVQSNNPKETLDMIERKWKESGIDAPLQYTFFWMNGLPSLLNERHSWLAWSFPSHPSRW